MKQINFKRRSFLLTILLTPVALLFRQKSYGARRSAVVNSKKCTGCSKCIRVCPHNAITLVQGYVKIDKTKCTGCSRCAEICCHSAITMI